MLSLCLYGCTNQNTKPVERVVDVFDSLAHAPVEEGYVPEHKIDFSHSIHSQLDETNDCKSCHKTPGEKVEFSICTSCHKMENRSFENIDYYDQLDSISAYIRAQK